MPNANPKPAEDAQRCRYEDCSESHPLASAEEQVTCATCRRSLGLPELPEEFADYGIKARKEGEKSWRFVTPGGGTTRLRIHAARFTSNRASMFVVQMAKDNPGYDFKRSVL